MNFTENELKLLTTAAMQRKITLRMQANNDREKGLFITAEAKLDLMEKYDEILQKLEHLLTTKS